MTGSPKIEVGVKIAIARADPTGTAKMQIAIAASAAGKRSQPGTAAATASETAGAVPIEIHMTMDAAIISSRRAVLPPKPLSSTEYASPYTHEAASVPISGHQNARRRHQRPDTAAVRVRVSAVSQTARVYL